MLIKSVISLCAALLISPAFASSESLRCEDHAAIVDSAPLGGAQYAVLQSKASMLSDAIYQLAPINGGRYWVRSDFADGHNATPYPHLGCFADIRVAIAWVCESDRDYVKRQMGCQFKQRSKSATLPLSGCLSLPIALREPLLYCAPGSSPTLSR